VYRCPLYERWGKRALDIALASLLLVLTAPAMAVVALLVRARLGSPVLFRQWRAGRGGGAPFEIRKFRSMRDGPGEDADRLTPLGRCCAPPRSTSCRSCGMSFAPR
jgi:lipopolysaccharide/colanic/teichoic acid biosynthesis glycosyltransferase